MNKIFSFMVVAMLVTTTSCDSKLEIQPYGESTLATVDELETLLNRDRRIFLPDYFDLDVLCNNSYRNYIPVTTDMSAKNSIRYALFAYDESVDRAALSETDQRYNMMYKEINYSNTVISKMPGASGGTEQKKRQLIAEAKVLRAWFHFLLVNMYAKQYDVTTAEIEGGIPYVDNTDVSELKKKLTLAETYQRILEDCSDEILADLVQESVEDVTRFGLDFGYGVRARVLFQMKRYDEALVYANKALSINGRLEDRSSVKSTLLWELPYESVSNYLLLRGDNSNFGDLLYYVISDEVVNCIDENDYLFKYYYNSTYNVYAWDNPMVQAPAGCRQCQMDLIRWNIWGLRSESMYYLTAECLIRSGKIQDGLAQIDKVRKTRIENPEIYSTKPGLTEADAMKLLQDSKRFEFIKTFENYFDRKRWNTEDKYKKTITRDLTSLGLGKYSISPDSPLWVFPFPISATKYNSTLTQNY